jgi:hypothetical protein
MYALFEGSKQIGAPFPTEKEVWEAASGARRAADRGAGIDRPRLETAVGRTRDQKIEA